jgi:hypothetical protein
MAHATIQCRDEWLQIKTAHPGRDVNKFLLQLLGDAFPGLAVKNGTQTDIGGTRMFYTVDIPCPLDLLIDKLSSAVAELRAVGFEVEVRF